MAETLNMRGVTVAQFAQLVREQIEDGDLTPVIGIGLSGIGKTECIYDLTKEMGIGFCELRLVTMTETDLLGVPLINEYGRTDWASNNLLPDARRDGPVGILVLDEITSATSTIRAAAYQLLDSKRSLGNYKLPDGWLVVGLGNGPDDGGVFTGMESAFLSRCRCWRVEPSLESWRGWAIKKDVHPTIIQFLSAMPEYLHKLNPDEMAQVFPCPRSWAALSKKLTAREAKAGGMLDQESVDIYTAASVGSDVAVTFGAFYKYNKKVISVKDILDGKADTNIKGVETQVIYLTAQNLVLEMKKVLERGSLGAGQCTDEAVEKLANACNWVAAVGNEKLDVGTMVLTDLSQNVPEFTLTILESDKFDKLAPKFLEFVEKHSVLGNR